MIRGHDVYEAFGELDQLFLYVREHKITIYHLHLSDKIFFTSTFQYRKVLSKNPQIHYLYSIGLFGMIFRFFLSKEKILAAGLSVLLFFGLSHTVFDLTVQGDSFIHQKMIEEKLSSYKLPFFYFDSKSILKKMTELNQQLNWYALYQRGSKLEIHFLSRQFLSITEVNAYDLIASKSGVIASFDVSRGNKVVKIHQKVEEGDLLVSHLLMDSSEVEKTSEVMGKVYAYTFEKVEVEFPKNHLPMSINYYLLLMKSRMMLQLDDGEHIEKEIVLHFSEDLDTIRMSNMYVLYEMISTVGAAYE